MTSDGDDHVASRPTQLARELHSGRRRSDDEDAVWGKQVEEEIREAASKVEKAGPPALETMFEEVYAQLPWHLAEERDEAVRAGKERG